MSELVGPAQWPKPGSGGTGGGTGTVTDVSSPDTSVGVETATTTPKLTVQDSPAIAGTTVTGTATAGKVLTGTGPDEADWQDPSGGGGADITVNNGPVVSSGLLPLAITLQPLVPPDGVLVPEPPLNGFQFTGLHQTLTLPTVAAGYQICAARDHNLWMIANVSGGETRIIAVTTAGTIARVLPATGTPHDIFAGPGGKICVVQSHAPSLLVITPTTPTTPTTIALPTAAHTGGPTVGCTGPGPNGTSVMWVAGADLLTRVTPNGTVAYFPVGGGTLGTPYGIAAGPDGNVWVRGSTALMVFDPTGALVHTIRAATLKYGLFTGGFPGVATGPGPNGTTVVWTCTPGETGAAGAVCRIEPGTYAITKFTVGTPTHMPTGPIAPGGGDMWLAGSDSLWKVTVEGKPTRFPGPGPGFSNAWLAIGSDGAFYTTAASNGLIRWPFQVVMGGMVLTGLATADPTNKGEVWADTGTLVLSGHTAGGAVATGTIQTSTPVTVAAGTTRSLPLTGALTDPTSLFSITGTNVKITAAGTYLISVTVQCASAVGAATFLAGMGNLPAGLSDFRVPAGKTGFGTVSMQYVLAATATFYVTAANYDVAPRQMTALRVAVTKL